MLKMVLNHSSIGFVGTAVLMMLAIAPQRVGGQQRPGSQELLPSSTKAWISLPDAVSLVDEFNGTGLGQLLMSAPMQPAVANLRTQIEEFIRERNIRLGLGWEDIHNVRSGEICLAGIVLPDDPARVDQAARGSHGIVLLVDTAGNATAVEILLEKVDEELHRLGAQPVEMGPIHGTQVRKWLWPGVRGGPQRFTLIAVVSEWLLASDNEAVLREVLLRMHGRSADRLSELHAFQSVMRQVATNDMTPHIRWFVEPFGYIFLAQRIHDENQPFRRRRDNHAAKLRENGFDLINGVGGAVVLNHEEMDVFHRTFIALVPASERQGPRAKVYGLLDFRNYSGRQLIPETFAVKDAANYFTLTWQAENMLENIDEIVDAYMEKGYFNKMVKGMKEDGFDLVAATKLLDNRFTIISKVREPISVDSECVALVIWIKENPQEFFKFLTAFIGDGKLVKQEGLEYWYIDRTIDEDDNADIFDPKFGAGGVKDFDKLDQVDAARPFNLFGRVYIATHNNYVVIANNLRFVEELFQFNDTNLAVEPDFRRVVLTLDQLGIQDERVVTRGFGRLDRMIETNYQMFRQGRLPTSETMLAKILNRVLNTADDGQASGRTQRFDGTLLPDNFHQYVSPYLGPSGWAMEQLSDGWRITGVWLKKNELSEVADQSTESDRPRKK